MGFKSNNSTEGNCFLKRNEKNFGISDCEFRVIYSFELRDGGINGI
jgi:hypothetical protein